MLLKLKNVPLRHQNDKKTTRKSSRWNTRKAGGWNAYKELTTENLVLEGVGSLGKDVTKIEKTIDKELTSAKYKAFGKVTCKSDRSSKSKSDRDAGAVCEATDRDEGEGSKIEKLLAKQSNNFVSKITSLKETKCLKGRSAAVFQSVRMSSVQW